MPSANAPSHKVDFIGDKAVIRRLELFCGYDPLTDVAKPQMREFDRSKVAEMVEMTRRHIARGSLPKVVERHAKEGAKQETYGSVLSVDVDDRDGVAFMVGDVEIQRDYFDRAIANNAFSRRSAEFWPEGHMSEVALLGRETPMRPLPDTRFAREGNKLVFEMESAMTLPGDSNTFTPAPETEKGKRKRKEKDKTMSDEDRDYKAECARLQGELDSLKATKTTFERQAEESKQSFERQLSEAKATFERRLCEVESKAKFERELDALQTEGYPVKAHRETMLSDLMSSKDADGKLKFWRATMSKAPIGVRVDTNGTENADGKRRFSREELDALVRKHAGDPKGFREAIKDALPA